MKKYNIIYADPPWKYKNYNYATASRGQEKEYTTMSIEEIKSLPVHTLTAVDCILFLWVCFPILKESIAVIESWGFTYKTIGFIWIKKNKHKDSFFWGMGNWTRSNAELCLIGIKGNPKRASAAVHQLICEPIDRHSKKPGIVRDKIVTLCGDVPRMELFARQTTEGWDVWGNEVNSIITLKS